ncbi:MAG: PqqD family protein, partial [Gammaproteobacteria bacterium]
LEVISEADVLAQVVWQNFAREAEAPVILAVLSRLVATARRFRLRYDRAEDAVDVLQREFAEWPDALPAVADPQADSSEQAVAAATLVARQYRQKPGISMVEVDDQFFLADRQGAAIHHLNPIGSSIWGLLEQPVTLDEIVEILLTAFPDLDSARVRADVGSLLQELMRKDLLQYGGD